MRLIFLFSLVTILFSCGSSEEYSLIADIANNGNEDFQTVFRQKDKYEIQILFSPISRVRDSIIMEDHFYNFRPDDYFYPASSVKMPVAFLALQKLNELKNAGIDINRNTPLTIDSIRPPQRSVLADTTSNNGLPSITQYIDKLFAISDNDAYNRLYEFTTQDYINSTLRNKSIFTNSRIVHRVGVGGFSFDENKWSSAFNFLDSEGNRIYNTKPSYAQGNWLLPISNTQKGIAYINSQGNKIEEPFDFSQKNFINIKDLQESLRRFILPEMYSAGLRYDISESDRAYALESMAKLPRDFDYLKDNSDYYDSYVKFFLFGDNKEPIPEHITIRNKVGFAYGYLTDCAYIQDKKHNIEYFLTATIHVNENQTYNDGIYEYDEVGIPFLAELGRLVHKYMIEEHKVAY